MAVVVFIVSRFTFFSLCGFGGIEELLNYRRGKKTSARTVIASCVPPVEESSAPEIVS